MKTDRELLELAAKAAGIRVERSRYGLVLQCHLSKDRRMGSVWNPLEDDGDALRLAVALDFGIEVHRALAVVHAGNGEQPKMSVHWNLVDVPDARTATRRAIVRAAAAIGEQTP